MTESVPTDLLPMRDVVSLTGINPVTLRAWERRHGLIRPQRTEGGHRLYTAKDVQRIRDIQRWTANGLPISKVGERLIGDHQPAPEPNSVFQQWRDAVARAARAFDGRTLEAVHGQLWTVLPKVTVLREVLLPVWHELASGDGFGERSQWLYLDNFLRARLLMRLQMNQPEVPPVLLAGLQEQAEFELLCAGRLLSSDQQRVEVLGCGQPFEELPLLCATLQPAALVVVVQGVISPQLAKRLRWLHMEIACPLALMGDELDASKALLQGTPVGLLNAQRSDVAQTLGALIRGELDL